MLVATSNMSSGFGLHPRLYTDVQAMIKDPELRYEPCFATVDPPACVLLLPAAWASLVAGLHDGWMVTCREEFEMAVAANRARREQATARRKRYEDFKAAREQAKE